MYFDHNITKSSTSKDIASIFLGEANMGGNPEPKVGLIKDLVQRDNGKLENLGEKYYLNFPNEMLYKLPK